MFNFRTSGWRRHADRVNEATVPFPETDSGAGDDAKAVAATHEAAGRAQEVIRAQLADLSQRHLVLRQAGETLEGLERSVVQLLSDHQRVRLASEATHGELEAEREQHTRLRQEFARLQEEAHGHKQARLQLETSLDNLQHNVQGLGGELAEAKREHAALQGEAGQLRGDLADALARASDAEDKVAFYRDKFEERQSQISALDASLKKELQQNAVLSEEVRALQESLENLNRTLARRDREHAAAQLALEQAAERRKELENALTEAERKHKSAEEELREALETTRATSGSTTNRLEAMASRLQVTENLLAQAREEIGTRTEEHSAAQRQVLQVTLEKTSLEKRVEDTRRERDRADRLARETSEINARLAERSHALVASLKTREREHEVAKQKLISLTEELSHLKETMRVSEQQFQSHVAELNAQVAHERSSRQMADGSLEAARSTIDNLRQEIARMRPGGVQDAGAHETRDEQARLPVAARIITRDELDLAEDGPDLAVDADLAAGVGDEKAGRAADNGGASRRNGARTPMVVVQAEDTERFHS